MAYADWTTNHVNQIADGYSGSKSIVSDGTAGAYIKKVTGWASKTNVAQRHYIKYVDGNGTMTFILGGSIASQPSRVEVTNPTVYLILNDTAIANFNLTSPTSWTLLEFRVWNVGTYCFGEVLENGVSKILGSKAAYATPDATELGIFIASQANKCRVDLSQWFW